MIRYFIVTFYFHCKNSIFSEMAINCTKSSAHVINSRALIGEKPCINKAIHARAVNARLRKF